MQRKKVAPWYRFEHEASLPRPLRARALDRLQDEIEGGFSEVFRWLSPGGRFVGAVPPAVPAAGAPHRPRVDISEGRKAYTVRVDLPGMALEDLSVALIDATTLVIRGERRREREAADAREHWIERSCGLHERVLSLPEDADGESIDASFALGVLKLRIPKKPARASRARSIEIQPG